MRARALTIAIVLLAAACGGDDGVATTVTTPATTSTTTPPATTTTVPTTTLATTTTSAAPTTTTTTTTTTVALFEGPVAIDLAVRDESDPVLPPTDQAWDSSFSYSPDVVFHDGRFHMFYTGWGVNVAIGYAVSDDGRSFTRVGAEPVLSIRDTIEGRTHFAEAPVVHVLDDGTWVMYFGLLQGKRFPGKSIFRATAPAPEGPWTRDDAPIYTATSGEWDDEIVPQSVAVTGDGIHLFYDGRTGRDAETGLLVSTDGVTFAPHDDPATPYGADPVIGVPGVQAWDGAGAASPVVFATDDGFEMVYVGFEGPDSGERILRIGYAVSEDGREWRRYAGNPVVVLETQRSAPASLGFPWTGGARVGDTYYLYYALAAGAEGIGVLTGTIAR